MGSERCFADDRSECLEVGVVGGASGACEFEPDALAGVSDGFLLFHIAGVDEDADMLAEHGCADIESLLHQGEFCFVDGVEDGADAEAVGGVDGGVEPVGLGGGHEDCALVAR